MQLLVIRHLPTRHNQNGLLQGRLDLDIEPPDKPQLQRITENQGRIQQAGAIDQVLCSSLKRTVQTARAYGYDEETCIREPLLNELDFGGWEGLPRQQMWDALGDAWWRNPQKIVLGEPVLALQQRVTGLIEKYAWSERLLLFSHGAWTRALLAYSRSGNIRDMNRETVDNNDLLYLTLE